MVSLKLLEAAERGDVANLEVLKDSLTEDVSDELGANCLHYAARQNGIDVLHFLVKQKGFSGKKRSNIGMLSFTCKAADLVCAFVGVGNEKVYSIS